jgi:hypothetical protein
LDQSRQRGLYRGARSALVKWEPRNRSRAATRSKNTLRFSTGKLPAAVMTRAS